MGDNINPHINGNAFGVEIDMEAGIVKVGGELFTDKPNETRIFYRAYILGRDHKKIEIRKALGLV